MTARSRPSPLIVVAIFVATLAGHFTLDRIGLKVPVLNDVRVLFFSALLMLFALETHHAGVHPLHTGPARRSLQPILILFAYQMLSAFWAPANAVITDVLGDLVAMVVLTAVYTALAEWDRDRVVVITLYCLYVAAWMYFLYSASGHGQTETGRWTAFGGGPNVYVRVMVLGMLASAYFYFRSGGRFAWLAAAPIFLVGAIASGSRGGLIALGMITAVGFPSLARFFRKHGWIKPLSTIPMVGAFIWIFFGDQIMLLINNRFLATTLQQRHTSDRDVLYEKGFWLFLESPVFGVGVHGFYAITNLGPGEKYVHNLMLAVAAEGGAAGLLLLWLALWALRQEYARVPKRQRSLPGRTAAFCGLFIMGASFFSGDYYDQRLMWIFLLLAAVHPEPPPRPPPIRTLSRTGVHDGRRGPGDPATGGPAPPAPGVRSGS